MGFVIALLPAAEPVTAPASFQPPGMWIWDNWFARDDGGHWHAFYQQLPRAVGQRTSQQGGAGSTTRAGRRTKRMQGAARVASVVASPPSVAR